MEDEIEAGRYVRNMNTGQFGIVLKVMPDKRYLKVRVIPRIHDIWHVDEVEYIKDAKE